MGSGSRDLGAAAAGKTAVGHPAAARSSSCETSDSRDGCLGPGAKSFKEHTKRRNSKVFSENIV